jgi:hypothetical protein
VKHLAFLLVALLAARADEVDSFLISQLESRHLPGVSIAIVKNGEPLKH